MGYGYKMVVAYDGTPYGGWQIQPNAVSVQEKIQEALKTATRETVGVTGSGRTDAGVHALGQAAHFTLEKAADPYRLRASLNGLLPKEIRILDIEEASDDFHARYNATSKCYRYHLTLTPVQLPFHRLYSWHCRQPLDIATLKQAAAILVGTHDFTSFANEPTAGSVSKNPVRTLLRIDIVEEAHGLFIEFEADGFLYKMVRNSVGTLVEAASGKRSVADVAAILAGRDRRLAGMAAPPQGLFLMWVRYDSWSSGRSSKVW